MACRFRAARQRSPSNRILVGSLLNLPDHTPVVAIVGRPNVGKSTLFNRLTGTRAALVSDLPGLTRDRREGTADLFGNEIRLVDTAGLEEAQRRSIAARMRKQSEQAIATADLILFVIDARAGVTGSDKEFARIARQSVTAARTSA